jgi:hypothetical protein
MRNANQTTSEESERRYHIEYHIRHWVRLARMHSKVVFLKLSCGSVGNTILDAIFAFHRNYFLAHLTPN